MADDHSSGPADGPVRFAMIGGGSGAFIGPVHRSAARLDGNLQLAAGCFSSDPVRNRETGAQMGLAPERVYSSHDDLLKQEARRPAAERIEFITIVTPNHLHAPISIEALKYGFAVLCEKPLAMNLAEARAMAKVARDTGLPFALTYTYLGYPLVREARALVAEGAIGEIVRVDVSYTQGWLARSIENEGDRQAAWRTDPAQSGVGGAIGDIGVHAQNLAEYVSGQQITKVCADLRSSRPSRQLDDDASMMLHFDNGARGTLVASQICSGDENRLVLSVHGSEGSLRWEQEHPTVLWHCPADAPARRITANSALLTCPEARAMVRLPGGHPEGYIEAFSNIYRAFAESLRGKAQVPATIEDGVRSLAFVEAAIASSAAGSKWQSLEP